MDNKDTPDKQPYKKISIPKHIKDAVWDTYAGKQNGLSFCTVCYDLIDSKHFECGHVQAEANGGKTCVENMRPVCSKCNKYMRCANMFVYKLDLYMKGVIRTPHPRRFNKSAYTPMSWIDELAEIVVESEYETTRGKGLDVDMFYKFVQTRVNDQRINECLKLCITLFEKLPTKIINDIKHIKISEAVRDEILSLIDTL